MRIRMRSSIRTGFAATLVAMMATGALLVAPAAGQDPRIPLPSNPDQTLVGYCAGFNVEMTFTDANQYIIHQTTALDGTTTLDITGRARVTLKNLSTDKKVSYNISGPGTVVLYPDGAFSVDAHGPNLFWTLPANSFPGVPAISYTTGHVTFQVNASGNTTSYSLSGSQTDVCRVLAS
jgi:hypothetical protein